MTRRQYRKSRIPIELRNPAPGSPEEMRRARLATHEMLAKKLGREPTWTDWRVLRLKQRHERWKLERKYGVKLR